MVASLAAHAQAERQDFGDVEPVVAVEAEVVSGGEEVEEGNNGAACGFVMRVCGEDGRAGGDADEAEEDAGEG